MKPVFPRPIPPMCAFNLNSVGARTDPQVLSAPLGQQILIVLEHCRRHDSSAGKMREGVIGAPSHRDLLEEVG